MKIVKKPSIPRRLNPTERKLASMFLEGVSTNLVDSGLVYGYNYDYNRENPVWEQPESQVEFSVYADGTLDITLQLNTFKLLANQLEYDKEANKKFQKWVKKLYDADEYWRDHLDEFPAVSRSDFTPERWIRDNTCNGDTLLDQQFEYDYCPDSGYVILQIHNGCDIRWGYTNPVFFRVDFCNDFNPYRGGSIYCSDCRAFWDYDCCTRLDYCNQYVPGITDIKDYPCEKGEECKKGIVVVNEKHEAFCPVCGKGKLE